MRIFSNIFVVIFLLITISCGSKIFPAFEVVNVDVKEDRLSVVFNSTPNRNSLINAFSFSCDLETINGDFVFSDDEVCFYPEKNIETGHDYILSISIEAEDINGLSLNKKYTYKFSTKTDYLAPKILSITPTDEEIIDENIKEIKIIFNEPIKEKSFLDSFSIKPNCDYILNWNDEKSEVNIQFAKPLLLSTRYTITITTNLCDLNNNLLKNEYVSTFTNGMDKEPPSYEVYEIYENAINKNLIPNSLNSELRTKGKLRILFNEEVNTSNISSNISIKPDMSISIDIDEESKKQVDVIFTKVPEWDNQEYNLTISKGITDVSSNEIKEDKLYRFKFNNESDRPVSFVKGVLELSEGNYFSIDEKTNYSSLLLPVENFPTTGNEEKEVILYYIFRISNNADSLKLISAVDNIFSISATNSCIYTSFSSIKILDDTEIKNNNISNNSSFYEEIQNVIDENGKLSAVMLGLKIENTDYFGQISFNINKELKDNIGNCLAEDLVFKYNKQ